MTEGETDLELEPAKQTALESLFSNLPEGFDERCAALRTLRDAFHRLVGSALRPSLQAHVIARPDRGIVDRKETAAYIDSLTRELGVTTGSDKGQPLLLVAEKNLDGDAIYTFFGPREPTKKIGRIQRSRNVPELHLIPAPSNIESMFEVYRPTTQSGRTP